MQQQELGVEANPAGGAVGEVCTMRYTRILLQPACQRPVCSTHCRSGPIINVLCYLATNHGPDC